MASMAAESVASSHQIKRFFYAFSPGRIWLFRGLIQQLFLWRLRLRNPEVVVLGMDSMVVDNHGAEKREGVEPTYKGTEGFHPFQIPWDRFVADAILRGGSKHSNDGDTATKAIRHLTRKIRKALGKEIPIVVRMDSGFFDKKIYQACEELGIGYVGSGRLLEGIKDAAEKRPSPNWALYQNGSQEWAYHERGNRRGTWSRFRRMIYTRARCEAGQRVFDFACTGSPGLSHDVDHRTRRRIAGGYPRLRLRSRGELLTRSQTEHWRFRYF